MDWDDYLKVFREMLPEMKCKLWMVKVQDVLDNWNLKDEELELARLFAENLSVELFSGNYYADEMPAKKSYDHLLKKGHSEIRFVSGV